MSHGLYASNSRVGGKPTPSDSGGSLHQQEQSRGGDFSVNMTFVSNYISYGTSNTNNLPALQGELSYSIPEGFYVSLWGSNNILDGWMQSLELYPSVGWTGKKDAWSWYLLAAYDAYFFRPKNINPSYFEVEGAISHQFSLAEIWTGMTYSPNYYASAGTTFFPFVLVNIPLQGNIKIHMQVAHSFIQYTEDYGVPNYNALMISISKSDFFNDINAGLYFYNTSVKLSECFPKSFGIKPSVNTCGPGIFLRLSRQFL